jgi:ubiquinone/menaquinone biosynthesis C-methylase UbiE
MPLFNRLKQFLSPSFKKELEPAYAYNQWSSAYDSQPGNLMLALDEQIFTELLSDTTIQGKIIADIGCGTGRYWAKIMDKKPAKLIGYDISTGMLGMLLKKFPQAETHLLINEQLPGLADKSCDLMISTLTVAHIPHIKAALQEWRRVLKPDGEILITDYHPDALAKGGQRTFRHNDKTIAVRNHIHTLPKIMAIARQLDLKLLRYIEKKIDDSVKSYYEQQQAIPVYERFFGVNIIYGLQLKAPGVIPS